MWAFIARSSEKLGVCARFGALLYGEPSKWFEPRRTLIVITLTVPKAGGLPTTKVNVVRWLKQEGDALKRGEAVVELQTDKVNYELDSPADGILLKILTMEGTDVPVGDAVCHIGQAGDVMPQQ